ncbi:probable disease resistance protein At4g27220 [Chenopodium quinoa]|uniref:probable disease resistance protein At4g27220 n=1 Tax=Chenopodium quinoa TaxID=63459 RepID=UPI000B78E623|nr:probable disease resistance protein At4g27220 [Chenopodium quinoa]
MSKLSFDEFHNEESQICFLYCALFPEDYDVCVEDLLRYGIGDRLFSDDLTLDQARNRVHSIISNLKASCLLLSGKNEECVKMHDVFRDLAILISSGNDYSFMVKAGSGLKEWPCNLNLQYVMRMSLINNEFNMLREQEEYPELILLLLQNNTSLKAISDDFFVGMKALQVLDLSNMPSLVALPTSLSFLTNLKTLCVENNNLKDGSALGELKSIEILSLRKSSFDRFPEEIKRLTKLRLVDLSESQFDEIPANVFPSLVRLEELYMGGSYSGWEIKETTSKRKATLAEVLSLDHLNTLHIDVGNLACLVEEIINRQPRLNKFHIHVGDKFDWRSTYAKSMCFNIAAHFGVPKPFMNWLESFLQMTEQLSVVNWKNLSSLEELPLECFQPLKHLHIQKCHFQTFLSSTLFERFQGLQELQIFSCLKLDTVFLSNNIVPESNVLPRLTNIHVRVAPCLTALWRGVAPSTSFQSLKHVKVEECKLVKILFPLAIAKMLNQLQYLEISNCDVMEAVIGYIEDHEIQMGTSSGQLNNTCTGIEYTHTIFPQLQSLKLQHLKNIRSLTQPWFLLVFPTLEHLTVLSCPCLKLPIGPEGLQRLIEVRAERKWFDELEFENNETKISLQKCFTDTNSSTQ